MEIEKLVLKILIVLLDATYLEIIASLMTIIGASLVAQKIKHLPTMWETWVRSLGWEEPLEEGMATHSSILAWGTPMDRGAWRATVHGVAKSRT